MAGLMEAATRAARWVAAATSPDKAEMPGNVITAQSWKVCHIQMSPQGLGFEATVPGQLLPRT